jgi:TonB family protein
MNKAEAAMKTLLFLTLGISLYADIGSALSQARQALNRGELVNAEQILKAAIDSASNAKNLSVMDEPLDLLAQVYQREKKYPEAAATQQRRIDIWASMFGDNAVIVGRILGQLASLDRQAGNLPEAEFHSRRALAILTAAFLDKPPVAQAAMDLADILIAEHRDDEAEQMFALARRMFEASLGPSSTLTTGAAARLATLLRQSGHVAEANQLTQTAPAPVFRPGGTGANLVAAPRILSKVEPKYSEEARKNKLQGSIQLSLIVDATGMPTQIAVLRPLGMGLDESAIEAVSQWRFAPGTKNGAPVAVSAQIEVTLRLL